MADILCPNCGMPNPDDQSVCSFCRQPLRAPEDTASIRPGDMPTKKSTAELEPILPDWLREARASARQAAEGEKPAESNLKPAQPAQPESAPLDFLAGLEAIGQEEEQEEIPEWMRGSQPTPPPAKPVKPAGQETPEENFPRRQEIRWENEPAEEPPVDAAKPLGGTQSEDGIPFWMKGLEEEAPEEKKEVSDWLSKQEPAKPAAASPFEAGSFRPNTGELIDWLRDASQADEPTPAKPGPEPTPTEAASFDWLKEEASKPFAPFHPSQAADETPPEENFSADFELPDWMKSLTGAEQAGQTEETNAPKPTPPAAEAPASQPVESELPSWLPPAAETPAPQPAEGGLPDWMKPAAEAPAPKREELPSFDWLTSAPASEAETPAPSQPEESSLPDWMKSLQDQTAPAESGAEMSFDWLTNPQTPEEPKPETPPTPSAPAFVPGTEPLETGAADELFSANLPDWLSNIAPTESKPSAEASQPEQPQEEAIAPAELPSWVQAMRPVETALPETPATTAVKLQPLEKAGPLAGLRGVLPATPGFEPSSKPKAYSLRLQPTQDQLDNAALLEQMLASEAQPKPFHAASAVLLSQRVLRWVVAALLFIVIIVSLVLGIQILPMPAALSPESLPAAQTVSALPENAPVLLIFDYEPALAGELETTSASFIDGMIGTRHPRLTLLSTSPTGPALAEHFMAGSQTRLNYQRGQDFVDLGYLPGESTGILAFAMNPRAAMPIPDAWNSPALSGVTDYSKFDLVILFTDRAETARAWVEQTTGYRNDRPLVVISSAQAAPLIQPYLFSGQVNGLVSGLSAGASFEQVSGNAGPARQAWDAYNLSILLVCVMIVIGGIWNFVLGIRARRQGLDEG